jgi:RNA polymerase sigma factor (sigma-70 family)
VAIRALFAAVASWARGDLSNASDREDVVAETCAEVVLGLDKAYGALTFVGFVRGIYRNVRRRVNQRTARITVPLEDLKMPAPQAGAASPDERALLQQCLGELSVRMRYAIELRYLHGASTQEIARDLNLTTSNARQIVSRGLALLQQCARRTWPLGRE